MIYMFREFRGSIWHGCRKQVRLLSRLIRSALPSRNARIPSNSSSFFENSGILFCPTRENVRAVSAYQRVKFMSTGVLVPPDC